MSKLPFFPFYVSDFKSATDYLDPEDIGLYVRMLCLLWDTPTCSFPKDFDLIKRKLLVKNNGYDEKLKYILDEFFTVKRGKYIQKRLMQEYDKAKDSFEKHSKAGKKSVAAKALKNNKKDLKGVKAMLKHSSNHEPTSISTPTSINKKDKKKKYSINENWKPSEEIISLIAEKESTTNQWVKKQIYTFVNYWVADGKTTTEQGWNSTFRNWCNRSRDEKPFRLDKKVNGIPWESHLTQFRDNGIWYVPDMGPYPTTDKKPDGPLNPDCNAPPELIKQILNVGDLL